MPDGEGNCIDLIDRAKDMSAVGDKEDQSECGPHLG